MKFSTFMAIAAVLALVFGLAFILVPVVTFLMATPFAFLDLAAFLGDAGFEIRHYAVQGHTGFIDASSKPGWPHMLYQLHQIFANLGLPNTIVIVIGFFFIALRRTLSGVIVLLVPFIYFFLATQTRVTFHRNLTFIF